MSGIHPVSAAVLLGFGVVALITALVWSVHAVQRWRVRRREAEREDEIVIDLTFLHSAVRSLEQASTRSRGRSWRITVDDEQLLRARDRHLVDERSSTS